MKTIKLFFLLIAIFTLQSIQSQTFVLDGINYQLTNETLSVRVIANTPAYSGEIIIPSTVIYNAQTYTVREFADGGNPILMPFYNCTDLTSITIPNSITKIPASTFNNCTSLQSVNIPTSITVIESNAFAYCSSLTTIDLPNSITSIKAASFQNSGLTSIVIPDSVLSIEQAAFTFCTSLTSVTIPNSVTTIDSGAFKSCFALTTVNVNWQNPLIINANTFVGVNLNNVKLKVPCGRKAAYQAASVWSNFNPIEEQCTLTSTEILNQPKITFYPNPAKDKIIFSNEVQNVKIYSATGQLLKTKFSAKEAEVSSLLKGNYIILITDKSGNTSSHKLIKE